jgi:DNA-binding winged helix-turn-helix (wHTH) protein
VKWGNTILSINHGADFKVMSLLVEKVGTVVCHLELRQAVKPGTVSASVGQSRNGLSHTKAPPEVKDAVTHIRKALRDSNVPYIVKSKKALGYTLLSHTD